MGVVHKTAYAPPGSNSRRLHVSIAQDMPRDSMVTKRVNGAEALFGLRPTCFNDLDCTVRHIRVASRERSLTKGLSRMSGNYHVRF
jgi:hypothetical protein